MRAFVMESFVISTATTMLQKQFLPRWIGGWLCSLTHSITHSLAQRILAQSLAKDFGPKGIHVAYLIIDAFINTPWTRTRIEQQFNKPDEIFTQPKDIAEEIYHIAHQPRSAWSFDVELRPDIEKW